MNDLVDIVQAAMNYRNDCLSIIIILILIGCTPDKEELTKVDQWGIFETTAHHSYIGDHPYEEVSSSANIELPSGKIIQVSGFYDGENTWKIRYMPQDTGIHSYNININGHLHKEGSFLVTPSEIPGLIDTYEPNPIWFGYRNGEAELIRSLHIGDRFSADSSNTVTGEYWDESQRTELLDWVKEQGYNTLSVASMFLNREDNGRGQGWNTPDLWNDSLHQPNYLEYRRLEQILDTLSKRKLLLYPFAGFLGRRSDFPEDHNKRKLYLQYTMSRIGGYWNILYMLGGPEPLLKHKPYMTFEEVNKWALIIDSLDIYDHLLSCHNFTGDDLFKDQSWQEFGIMQGPKTLNRAELSESLLYNHHPSKPLYAQETLWPGNVFGHPDYTLDDVKKHALVMILLGANINFGDMNGNSSSGFSGKIDFSQKVQERHDAIKAVWNFMEGIPYYRMKPRQDKVNKGYCLAEEGNYYLIFLENEDSVQVTLTPGNYQGQWISIDDFQTVETLSTITDNEIFTLPENISEGILYITQSP